MTNNDSYHLLATSCTSAFVDLATLDEIEKQLYGDLNEVTYFVRQTTKCTWFSMIPVQLSGSSSSVPFGSDFSVTISRSGDYLLQTWLSVTTPEMELKSDHKTDSEYYWCKNFMHNLVDSCDIKFNDMIAQKFNSTTLDFVTAFSVPQTKREGYNKMIGAGTFTTSDGGDRIFIHGLDASVSHRLNLPLPFFFSKESGVALPVAAIPYNDMKINFKFRNLEDLLTEFDYKERKIKDRCDISNLKTKYLQPKVYANYAVVSNDERKLMGKSSRDICIEQYQCFQYPYEKDKIDYNARFQHSVKTILFGVRNSHKNPNAFPDGGIFANGVGGDEKYSNYMMKSTDEDWTSGNDRKGSKNHQCHVINPISVANMSYDQSVRFSQLGEYFSQVNPYYHQDSMSSEPGICCYSYAMNSQSLDPCGSTNFGKISNIPMAIICKNDYARTKKRGETKYYQNLVKSECKVCIVAINHNRIRVSGGAVGFVSY